ncbi:MAG: carboxypeptidase-like regulatory domain-containing protein [Myxococcota bacterium]
MDGAVAAGELTITLLSEGQPIPGPRIALRSATGEEVSRPTDVMGQARFVLAHGSWLVMAPEEVSGRAIDVGEAPVSVTLVLPPELPVTGLVVDASGAPVPSVDVLEERAPPFGASRRARTDGEGRFSFSTREETLVLSAESGSSRASVRVRPPATGVTLRLEPTAPLPLITPGQVAASVVVYPTRGDPIEASLQGRAEVRVPVQELEVRALRVVNGRLFLARHHVAPRGGSFDALVLEFEEAPPITGVVLDPSKRPLAAVQVSLALSPLLANGATPQVLTVLTDPSGAFEFVPRSVRGADPVYDLHVLRPWTEAAPTRVRLGDGPVVIYAVPLPPR